MKTKLTFSIISLIGATAAFFALLYLDSHDPKYGFDMVADRIIPIGFPLLSAGAAYIISVNFRKRIWVSASAFPVGVLVSILVSAVITFPMLRIEFLAVPAVISIALYIFGIVGAFAGIRIAERSKNRS